MKTHRAFASSAKKRFSKYCNFYRVQEFLFLVFDNLMKRLGNLYHRDLSYIKLMQFKCRTFHILDGCKLPVATLENVSMCKLSIYTHILVESNLLNMALLSLVLTLQRPTRHQIDGFSIRIPQTLLDYS